MQDISQVVRNEMQIALLFHGMPLRLIQWTIAKMPSSHSALISFFLHSLKFIYKDETTKLNKLICKKERETGNALLECWAIIKHEQDFFLSPTNSASGLRS